MKVYLSSGEEMIDIQCEGLSKLWHHCFYFGVHGCGEGEGGCPYWKGKGKLKKKKKK